MSTTERPAAAVTRRDLMGEVLYRMLLSMATRGVAVVADGETIYRQPNGAELNAILRYYERLDETQAGRDKVTDEDILADMAAAGLYDAEREVFRFPTDPGRVVFNPQTGQYDPAPASGAG